MSAPRVSDEYIARVIESYGRNRTITLDVAEDLRDCRARCAELTHALEMSRGAVTAWIDRYAASGDRVAELEAAVARARADAIRLIETGKAALEPWRGAYYDGHHDARCEQDDITNGGTTSCACESRKALADAFDAACAAALAPEQQPPPAGIPELLKVHDVNAPAYYSRRAGYAAGWRDGAAAQLTHTLHGNRTLVAPPEAPR